MPDKIRIEITENKQVICNAKGDSSENTITLNDNSSIEILNVISVTKPNTATEFWIHFRAGKRCGSIFRKSHCRIASKMAKIDSCSPKCNQYMILLDSHESRIGDDVGKFAFSHRVSSEKTSSDTMSMR